MFYGSLLFLFTKGWEKKVKLFHICVVLTKEWRRKEEREDFFRGKMGRDAVLEFGPNGISVSKTRPSVFKRI